ncbi:MAG TPA: F0F1 ATP synthase subunit B [Anaerolineae bacterium]|nr:F0F1 ATP synthase subunit B [Anaerolineae bacterium]
MLPLGIVPGIVLAQIINFVLLLLVLRVIAYKPLLRVLEQRRERIQKGLEDARRAEERLANIEKDYQAKLDAARLEGQKTVAEMTQNAEKQAAGVIVKANEDAGRIKAQAQEEAEAERNRILADLRSQVAALSIAAANKLIGAALDDQRQRALIDEFFSGVRSGKVMITEDSLSGKVQVTSALPLSEAEQTSIKSDLTGRGASDVEFRVDPKILGGLVVRAGDRIVDASVAGQLESLKQSLA